MKRDPVEHDYTRTRWGHSITFISIRPDGQRARVIGHGNGVNNGDYLILANGEMGSTRYRITRWEQKRPGDCWAAEIEFSPRRAEVAA